MKENVKIKLIKLITISLPLLVFIFIELFLRLFHVAPSLDLFVSYPENDAYYVFNPYFSKRYFSNINEATKGFYEPFKKEKEENTIRLFVQGASTAVGFPYFHNVSFHRQLKYALEQSYPDKSFEIINLALTAVNSYTLADQVDEIVKMQPDAILIYAGHNEYYGALGVASDNVFTQSVFVKKALIQFRRLAIVQVLSGLLNKSANTVEHQRQNNLMQRRAEGKEIPLNSKAYFAGLEQFRKNISALLETYQKENIPVFLSTVASNQKDLAPFISHSNGTVSDSMLVSELHQLNEKKDSFSAKQEIKKLISKDSINAALHFKVAECLSSQNDTQAAKEYFVKAKELDALRFRAPETINTIIRELGSKFKVIPVDFKMNLEANSANGIIGKETMNEHVHPNVFGYSVLAESFYNAIVSAFFKSDSCSVFSFEEVRKEMPVTVVDTLLGKYATVVMKESWPFNEPQAYDVFGKEKTKPEDIAGRLLINQISWDKAMEELYVFYMKNHDLQGAAKVAEATVLEHPESVKLCAQTAQLYSKMKDYNKAVIYYKKCFRMNPDASFARRAAQYLILQNKLDEAVMYFENALAIDRNDKISKVAKETVLEIQNINMVLKNTPPTAGMYLQLSMAYLKLENTGLAEQYYQKAKSLDAGSRLLKQIGTRFFEREN
nr:hypothetical protein [uncultured Draconibacterium sp.]